MKWDVRRIERIWEVRNEISEKEWRTQKREKEEEIR
jgi:hypothetical protein